MSKEDLINEISDTIEKIQNLDTDEIIYPNDENYNEIRSNYNGLIRESQALNQTLFHHKDNWEALHKYLNQHVNIIDYGNEISKIHLTNRLFNINQRLNGDRN